jgi:hypothetical protein
MWTGIIDVIGPPLWIFWKISKGLIFLLIDLFRIICFYFNKILESSFLEDYLVQYPEDH